MTSSGRRRKATLLDDQRRREQQFGERAAELAVLGSGPWSGGWYWRADLERQQEAARLVSEGYGSPLSTIAYYVPTDRAREHPTEDGVRGRVWAYEGPVSERAI